MFSLVIIVKRKSVIINGSDNLFSSQLNIEFVNVSFKNLCIDLLKLSTAPWKRRWYFPPRTCLIPLFSNNEDNVLFTNSFPLSVWKHWRISNYECLYNMISNCLCFFSFIGYAKPYLLGWSTIVKRYGYLLSSVILESSSTLSAWYSSYYSI